MKIKLTKNQLYNLKTHYNAIKDLPMGLGYTFKTWLLSYKDFPMILKYMANESYKTL